MTDVTVTNVPPPTNTPEARTPDGTLKDQSPPSTTPSPTPTPEGGDSFLTSAPKPAETPAPETPKAPEAPKPAETPKVEAAPEKYGDFKLPDGYEFDKTSLEQATAIFKDLGLSQDNAQKLVDFYAANSLQASEAPYKAWADLQKQWTEQIADRFPGEKATQVKSMISNVIDTVLPPSLAKNFRAAIDLTGAGSHPDFVEAMSIFLKPLSEGTPVRGNAPSPAGQKGPEAQPGQISVADALYGHLRK